MIKSILLSLFIAFMVAIVGGPSAMFAIGNLLDQWDITGPGYWHCFWFMFFAYGAAWTITQAVKIDEEIKP